jgi:hypothetical protein
MPTLHAAEPSVNQGSVAVIISPKPEPSSPSRCSTPRRSPRTRSGADALPRMPRPSKCPGIVTPS